MDCNKNSAELSGTILPIPMASIKRLHAVFGCGDNTKELPAVVENLSTRIVPGEEIQIPKIHDDDFLLIGLGRYTFGDKLKMTSKPVYLGVNNIRTLDEEYDLGSMAVVVNINVFMGVESALTDKDKYQLMFISFIIMIIIAVIAVVVSVEIFRSSSE
jgi:hypothetical protein